jgi:hypothetical protein
MAQPAPFLLQRSLRGIVRELKSHFRKKRKASRENFRKGTVAKQKIANPFQVYIQRSSKRKHVCTVTVADLEEIWEAQAGNCALTNIPMVHQVTNVT